MKKLIINADDFGLCSGINQGILFAHQKGILTSATLMVNMPGFLQAVQLTRENPSLGVGLHLNIIRGRPISSPGKIPTLLSNKGNFLPVAQLVKKEIFKKIKVKEIEYEFRAQIEKALTHKISLTHFDSEKHIHSLPFIMDIVVKLALEYKIPRIRFINEFCLSTNFIQSAKSLLLSFFHFRMKNRLEEAGILIPTKFYGICKSGKMNKKRLKTILSHLKEGVTEIMTHPGLINQEYDEIEKHYGTFYLRKERERELEALMDQELKSIIEKEKIQLIHFGHIRRD